MVRDEYLRDEYYQEEIFLHLSKFELGSLVWISSHLTHPTTSRLQILCYD